MFGPQLHTPACHAVPVCVPWPEMQAALRQGLRGSGRVGLPGACHTVCGRDATPFVAVQMFIDEAGMGELMSMMCDEGEEVGELGGMFGGPGGGAPGIDTCAMFGPLYPKQVPPMLLGHLTALRVSGQHPSEGSTRSRCSCCCASGVEPLGRGGHALGGRCTAA